MTSSSLRRRLKYLPMMCPNIIFARLRVILTFEVVTALLGLILIQIERHGHPFFLGSHAKKGIGYHVRVLSSIAPPYTTGAFRTLYSTWNLQTRFGLPPWPIRGAGQGIGGVALRSKVGAARLTIACKRPPIASARASLRLSAAPEAQRSGSSRQGCASYLKVARK